MFTGLLAIAVFTFAVIAWWWLSSATPRYDRPLLAEHLTTGPGQHAAPDFSPDGRQVVFCWNGYQENRYDIYALTIGSAQPRQLTTDAAAHFSPVWSPDGSTIAFLQGPQGGIATLMLMPAAGGPARKLSDTSMRVSPLYRRLDWSQDGQWIVMEDETSAEEGYGLVLVSVATGQRRKLTHPRPNQADMEPSFSPDGRTLAYIKDVGNGVSMLFLLPLTSALVAGEPRRLSLSALDNALNAYPRWLSERAVIFRSNRGTNRLWVAPVDGKSPPVVLASIGEEANFPTVSHDGKRLIFTRAYLEANIWSTPTEPAVAGPEKITVLTRHDQPPEFSPDGSRMLFRSDRSGADEIWVADANGGAARQLTNYGGPITGSPRWSPDGPVDRVRFSRGRTAGYLCNSRSRRFRLAG